jgi:hypothetical protein
MPRYHFHLHDRTGFTEDVQGVVLADPAQARERAIREARAIISDDVRKGRIDLSGMIEVTQGSGEIVLTIRFTEAVEEVPENLRLRTSAGNAPKTASVGSTRLGSVVDRQPPERA